MNGGRYDAEAAIAKTEPDACGSAQTERIASNAVAAGLPRGRSPRRRLAEFGEQDKQRATIWRQHRDN